MGDAIPVTDMANMSREADMVNVSPVTDIWEMRYGKCKPHNLYGKCEPCN